MYSRFRSAIKNVNVIIATYNDAFLCDVQVGFKNGTVVFRSGLHGWGFKVEGRRSFERQEKDIDERAATWRV